MNGSWTGSQPECNAVSGNKTIVFFFPEQFWVVSRKFFKVDLTVT